MKKTYLVLAGAILCALLAGCALGGEGAAAPAPEQPAKPAAETVLVGKVVQWEDGQLLVAQIGGEEGLYTLPDAALMPEGAEPAPGTVVEIGYDGGLQETYPLRIPDPAYIKMVRQEGDLVGLYKQVFLDLYETDTALNDGISLLAVDLTAAGDMAGAEKAALLYLLENATGVQARQATFEELADEGLVAEDEGFHRFDKGLLLSLEVTGQTPARIQFTAEKWRSSLGAYFFMDCTAKLDGSAWAYTVGAEAIS